MHWSPAQEEARSKVNRWLRSGTSQVFHLFGYAGTGKTSLAKDLASDAGDVLFGAYTGKAAHVLQTKGCHNAKTIHSMIYHSREKSKVELEKLYIERERLVAELTNQGLLNSQISKHERYIALTVQINEETKKSERPMFVLNEDSIVKDMDLIVIDECSMVDAKMGQDLLSFGTKVLVLGDPAQLPPVGGEGYFTKDVTPDVMLTEIHRQAADNPIIRMATQVRQEKPLSLGDYGENCRVIGNAKQSPEETLSYDQILVGKNATRHAVNRKIRKLKGIDDPYPIIGDRLVCGKNNGELGLLNGQIFFAADVQGIDKDDGRVYMSVRSEDGASVIDVVAHEHYLTNEGTEPAWFERAETQKFEFGYALTVHKSQGSQWDKVCVLNESWVFRQDRWKWLYTAITRAAKEVTVINM